MWPDMSGSSEPSCGCCGKTVAYGTNLTFVAINPHSFERIWRCEKHIGRAPCLIDNCGRTFALKGDEDYGVAFVCGTHWRQAPKKMRDAVRRVERLATRYGGWNQQLMRRHSRLFDRCVTAIKDHCMIDIAEIEAMF
jgi:hypothetical protein